MDTDYLLDQVVRGDLSAAATLLDRYRPRLRRMVALRIDPRLAARLDPSDIVQEALGLAHCRLRDYASDRPIPFYPWLRRIAWDRLLQMHRHHIDAQRRSVRREDQLPLSSQSHEILVQQLISVTPYEDEAVRHEVCARVQRAIEMLPAAERETIVLRHLEEMSFPEVASVQANSLAATYSRYYRAIKKLHRFLNRE